jgi:L-fuconate dehydratase
MAKHRITSLETRDVHFPLEQGAGSDTVHSGAEYAFATALLGSDRLLSGTGIVLTLGLGNQLAVRSACSRFRSVMPTTLNPVFL